MRRRCRVSGSSVWSWWVNLGGRGPGAAMRVRGWNDFRLTAPGATAILPPAATLPASEREYSGGVAQLGERVNGIHEVRGSIPLASIRVGMRGRGMPRKTVAKGERRTLGWGRLRE